MAIIHCFQKTSATVLVDAFGVITALKKTE